MPNRNRRFFRLLLLALAAACARPPSGPNTADVDVAPDAVAESLLVDVRDIDSTIRVVARYAGDSNFTGAQLPGYEANRALLRREPAAALARVQARLREQDLGLLIYDAYRPRRATLAMVAWTERAGRTDLLDDGYIARRSRHNMGVAVDLTLIFLPTGQVLEMGTEFDTFSPAAHTANAEGEIHRNRQTLVQAMEAEGFENYAQEWWHFSYPLAGAVAFDMVIDRR